MSRLIPKPTRYLQVFLGAFVERRFFYSFKCKHNQSTRFQVVDYNFGSLVSKSAEGTCCIDCGKIITKE